MKFLRSNLRQQRKKSIIFVVTFYPALYWFSHLRLYIIAMFHWIQGEYYPYVWKGKLFIRWLVLNEYECLKNNSHGRRSGNKSPKINYVKKMCPFQDMILHWKTSHVWLSTGKNHNFCLINFQHMPLSISKLYNSTHLSTCVFY